jgi:[ribosomal protein S18]-alanine N-acetyltransferase
MPAVRNAALHDLPAILAIEQAAPSAAHWTADQYKTCIHDGHVIVAEHASKICGFICARAAAGEWEIENIVVDATIRRTGVGSALLHSLLEKWKENEGASVFLEVREGNRAARSFYQKWGFRQVGRRRGYYRAPVEDALLYALRRVP